MRYTYLGFIGWELYAAHGMRFVERAFSGGKSLPGFCTLMIEIDDATPGRVKVLAMCDGGAG